MKISAKQKLKAKLEKAAGSVLSCPWKNGSAT
jgi:hypothetical protein